jgi:tetratricopeptide (TPR) repeat protein
VLSNLGLLSHLSGENDSAHTYSQQALEIAEELGDRSMEAEAMTHLGHALIGQNMLEAAEKAYRQGMQIREALGENHLAMESSAGLARALLAQGQTQQALAYVEEILTYLETQSLNGTMEPLRIYLTCYQVLDASQDPRAGEFLKRAYDQLHERADALDDEDKRRNFLEDVPTHREVVKAYESKNI